MSCGVGCRLSLDPALLWLWLWCRPAATVPIRPPAWELPYATSAALKRPKKKKKPDNLFLLERGGGITCLQRQAHHRGCAGLRRSVHPTWSPHVPCAELSCIRNCALWLCFMGFTSQTSAPAFSSFFSFILPINTYGASSAGRDFSHGGHPCVSTWTSGCSF